MKRHNARIVVTQFLFAWDFNKNNIEEFEEMFKELKDIYDEAQSEEDWEVDYPYAKKLAEGTINNLNEIDQIIINNMEKWTIDRLSYVDRALIRMATYEMMFTDTPINIIIDEAVEITKEYSNLDDPSQAKFNNRVLDNIGKQIHGR